jgi:hypothetical protein
MALLNFQRTQDQNPPGAIRPNDGKLILLNKELFTENPRNNPLLAAEKLNTLLCLLVACNPEQKNSLSGASTKDIAEALHSALGEDPRKTLDIIQRNQLTWDPNLGPWGTFLSPTQHTRGSQGNKDIPPFGAAEISVGGAQLRYETENSLNKALRLYLQNKSLDGNRAGQIPSLFDLCTFAIQKGQITPENVPVILAACEILDIQYDPNTKLFLSEQNRLHALEWLRWTE